MNRIPVRLFILSLTTTLAAVVAPVPAQAAPYCGITWGSTGKSADAYDAEVINDVRAGRHACFDRLVIDIGGEDTTFGSYDVRYVDRVYSEAKGDPVPVRGAADLQIVVRAPAYDAEYRSTYTPRNPREVVNVSGYSTFRQVAWGGSFEAQTTIALGVRARLPIRVFTLPGTPASDHTPRLVLDVAHRW